jgi:hypothetical protein
VSGEAQYDARDVRQTEWFWIDKTLLNVFLPLIGPDAGWLYVTLCLLLPERQRNPFMDLSIRRISKLSGQGTGTVHRNLEVLAALGMIEVKKGDRMRSSEFVLKEIPPLVKLGEAELVRRLLGVPWWNTSREYRRWKAKQEGDEDEPETASEAAISHQSSPEGSAGYSVGSTGSHAEGVPGGNTSPENDELSDPAPKPVDSGSEVFQKPGVGVPETGGLCSKSGGVVFQKPGVGVPPGDALIKTISNQTKALTPSDPEGTFGDLVLPEEDLRSGSRHFPMAVGIAARWVMHGCGISEPRLQAVVIRALELRCRQTGESLQEAAGLAATNTREYQVLAAGQRLAMQFGWEAFFGGGHWQNSSVWQLREVESSRPSDPGRQAAFDAEQFALHSARDRERVAAYVMERASTYESAGLVEAAVKIRALVAESDWIFTEVDEQLQAIEQETTATLMEEATELQLEQWALEIRKRYGDALRKMPPAKAQQAIEGRLRQRLLDERGLPRLSLFYAA